MFANVWEQAVVAGCIVIITFLLYKWRLAERALSLQEVPAFLCPRKRLSSMSTPSTRKVTIFVDGAFDMTHYGHMNAFRQARALGTRLVVGVNSDVSIAKCKGQPIMNIDERCEVVGACRFVDEIVRDVPYTLTPEDIKDIMEKYDIDYFVHGDDPCTVDGKDVYAHVKEIGRFKYIPRTEGVSTTDIVGRIVTLTKNVTAVDSTSLKEGGRATRASDFSTSKDEVPLAKRGNTLTPARSFYPTCRMIRCFGEANSSTPPKQSDEVVYIAGDWDVFNASHVATLRKARTLGTYVLVGVHSDEALRQCVGGRQPILNVYERVLAVLACRYVNDVVFDADVFVNKEMIDSFRIKKVLRLTHDKAPDEAYAVPKQLGILETLTPDWEPITPEVIAARILDNWDAVIVKQKAKAQKERDFYDQKYNH